jgi:hypothetical protein
MKKKEQHIEQQRCNLRIRNCFIVLIIISFLMIVVFSGLYFLMIQGITFTDDFNSSEEVDKLLTTDGGTYEGDVLNGLPEGKGWLKTVKGRVYEGDWKNGKFEGKGKNV